jgi:amidase
LRDLWLKPTHGLIPYTGIMPIETTLDHTGPMTATVEDNALLLQVLAGSDGLDPRQSGAQPQDYRTGLARGATGLRIAVIKEGFGHPQSMDKVDHLARAAAERFQSMGASVETVSLPMHRLGMAIWLPLAAEGGTVQMMLGNGFGFNWQGLYVTSLLDWHSGWRNRADELSDTLKQIMLIGHYMVTHYRGHYYAKAQNLVRRLRAAYDAVLANHDLLLMPTVPMTAGKLPEENAPLAEILKRGFAVNTAPFDCTHHPAMNVPCGLADGLPVGLMLVGRHCDEASIYRAAAAFERGVPWEQQTA